jgi:hypothetical protein
MTAPLSRIASAPAETMMLLDMTPRLDMHGIQPAGVECVVIPAKASQVHDALRGIEGEERDSLHVHDAARVIHDWCLSNAYCVIS